MYYVVFHQHVSWWHIPMTIIKYKINIGLNIMFWNYRYSHEVSSVLHFHWCFSCVHVIESKRVFFHAYFLIVPVTLSVTQVFAQIVHIPRKNMIKIIILFLTIRHKRFVSLWMIYVSRRCLCLVMDSDLVKSSWIEKHFEN